VLNTQAWVLLLIADQPRASLNELARRAAISERHVQRVITCLETAGYVSRTRPDERNLYTVHHDALLGLKDGGTVGAFLDAVRGHEDGSEPPTM